MSLNVDRVFDDIIAGERSTSHPNFKTSIRHSTPTKNDTIKRANENIEYVSPFRNSLSTGQMYNSTRLRDTKYPVSNPRSAYNRTTPNQLGYSTIAPSQGGNNDFARDITFPKELSLNEQRQAKELKEIEGKEMNLRRIKEAQRITTIDVFELDNNNNIRELKTGPVDVATAPRVPPYFFLDKNTLENSGVTATSSKKAMKKIPKGSTRPSKQESPISTVNANSTVYPVATPSNPEEIVYLKNGDHVSYHTKAVFDNVNHERQRHQLYLTELQKNQSERYSSKLASYDEQIEKEQSKIDTLKSELEDLEKEQKNLLEAEEQAVVKRYLQNIETYGKRKRDAVREIKATKLASEKAQKEEEEREEQERENEIRVLREQEYERERNEREKREEEEEEERMQVNQLEESQKQKDILGGTQTVEQDHEAMFPHFDSPVVVADNINNGEDEDGGKGGQVEYNNNIDEMNYRISYADNGDEEELFDITHTSALYTLESAAVPTDENIGDIAKTITSPDSNTKPENSTDIRMYGKESDLSPTYTESHKVNDISLSAEQQYENIREDALKRLYEVQHVDSKEVTEPNGSAEANSHSLENLATVPAPAEHFQYLEEVT